MPGLSAKQPYTMTASPPSSMKTRSAGTAIAARVRMFGGRGRGWWGVEIVVAKEVAGEVQGQQTKHFLFRGKARVSHAQRESEEGRNLIDDKAVFATAWKFCRLLRLAKSQPSF